MGVLALSVFGMLANEGQMAVMHTLYTVSYEVFQIGVLVIVTSQVYHHSSLGVIISQGCRSESIDRLH